MPQESERWTQPPLGSRRLSLSRQVTGLELDLLKLKCRNGYVKENKVKKRKYDFIYPEGRK